VQYVDLPQQVSNPNITLYNNSSMYFGYILLTLILVLF